ncbi:MAG: isochorismatase family cysteine hydrolase [Actinomycetes bacterium]
MVNDASTPGATDYVAAFTPTFDIDSEKACLVLVDLQYATGSPDHGLGAKLAREGRSDECVYRYERIASTVLPNVQRLLAAFREKNLRVLYFTYGAETQDYSDLGPMMKELCRGTLNRVGTREHEIIDEIKPVGDERVVNKLTPSGFTASPADLILRAYNTDTLIFAGVSTNMCVEHTLRDAADRGYKCILVEDACGADSQEMHDATLRVIPRLYGQVLSTDNVLASIAGG